MTRRQFIKRTAYSGVVTAAGAAGWGTYELKHLTVEQVELSVRLGPEAPANLKLVQLSDFHIDPSFDEEWIEHYVNAANALQPDVIALTGDFITKSGDALERLAVLLSKLKAPGGVFACLGNHDQWHLPLSSAVRILRNQGIRPLVNESVSAELSSGKFWIAGVESVWAGSPDPLRALAKASRAERAIFLAHEPDIALQLAADSPIAVQLSGHTHGGQIALPPGRAILLPRYGKEFARGLFTEKTNWPVYVNRGVGALSPRFRIASPPEITLMHLKNIA